jgi:hypothetical protein
MSIQKVGQRSGQKKRNAKNVSRQTKPVFEERSEQDNN